MSRHQRLQHTLRSPVRRHKQLKNRQTRKLRRAVSHAFLAPGATEIKPNERPPFGCCLLIWGAS